VRSNPPTLPPPHESCEVVTLCSLLVLLPPRRRAPLLLPLSPSCPPPLPSFLPSLLLPTAAATPFPFGLLVSVSCLAFGGATQRNENRRGPLCFIQNAPENVPRTSYTFPSVLTVSFTWLPWVLGASLGTQPTVGFHPPRATALPSQGFFFVRISPKCEKVFKKFYNGIFCRVITVVSVKQIAISKRKISICQFYRQVSKRKNGNFYFVAFGLWF
jgi:hypothetical protein